MAEPVVPPPKSPDSTSQVMSAPEAGRLMHFWSVRLPRVLDRWTPRLADSFADGAWLAGWRFMGLVPLLWLAVGCLTPWLWPGMQNIYSESLIFLALVIGMSIVSGTWATMLFLGYSLGDFLATRQYVSTHVRSMGFPALEIGWLAGHFLAYLLLALLVIRIPQLAKDLADGSLRPSERASPGVLRALRYGAIYAGLVFLWCQSMIVLIRPVFTWRNDIPTVAAVHQVQVEWPWLVGIAFVLAVARVMSEEARIRRSRFSPLVVELQGQRWEARVSRDPRSRSTPGLVRIVLGAGLITLILAGTYEQWTDAIAVFLVVAVLGAWRAGRLGKFPQRWISLMDKIPMWVRLMLAMLIGFVVSYAIQSPGWNRDNSFRPGMISALVTLALVHIAFPLTRREKQTEAA